MAAVSRVRALLDLDADPVAVDLLLGADPHLAPLVARRPGLRSPGAVDALEMAVRAIVGQQISVSGAPDAYWGGSSPRSGEPVTIGDPR